MNWMEILQPAVQMIVTAIIGLLASIIVSFIQTKKKEVLERVQDERARKYITMIAETIEQCVTATNQTYVDALKDKDIFDEEAHKEAFKKTYDAVMDILNHEAKDYIASAYGDVEVYITNAIEAQVNNLK